MGVAETKVLSQRDGLSEEAVVGLVFQTSHLVPIKASDISTGFSAPFLIYASSFLVWFESLPISQT